MAPSITIDVQRSGDYRFLVLDDLAAGWWPLSDAVSSSSAVDSSGNVHNGTALNITFGVAGHRPDGATIGSFNGSTSRVTVADAAVLHLGDVGSVECWLKRSSVSLGAIVALFDGNSNAVILQIDTDNKLRVAKSGGAQIVKSTVAITDITTWHHVVYTKSGSTSKLYLDSVDVTGAVTDQTLSNSNGLTIGSATGGASFYPGALSDVAYYSAALTAAQVLAHYNAGLWTSLTLDISDEPVRITRGYQSNSPSDRIAAPSMLNASLNNSTSNNAHAQGYYSPERALLSGWQDGLLIRVQVTANGNTRTRFWGWISVIDPDPGIYGEQRVPFSAESWLAFPSAMPAFGLSVQTNQRDDQLLPQLVALVPTPPYATSFALGLEVYPYVFDDLNPSSARVIDAMNAVVMSGFYRLHEWADGTIIGETRQTRQLYQSVDTLSLSDVAPGGQPGKALSDLRAPRRRDRVINEFVITVTPRSVDPSPAVLYSLPLTGSAFSVAPMSNVTFEGNFVDPTQTAQPISGINMLISNGAGGAVVGTVGFLPTADYAFGSSAGLSDMNALVTVAVVYEGPRATFTVTNTDGSRTAYCTLLQCRGQGLRQYQQVVATAGDLVNQRTRGKNSVPITCPYQADPNFAASAAQYHLHLYGPALTQLDEGLPIFVPNTDEVTLDALLALEISAPIAITETMSGLSAGKYWLDAIEEDYDERMNATITLRLSPRDPQPYWVLGTVGFSEIGTTTFVGF